LTHRRSEILKLVEEAEVEASKRKTRKRRTTRATTPKSRKRKKKISRRAYLRVRGIALS